MNTFLYIQNTSLLHSYRVLHSRDLPKDDMQRAARVEKGQVKTFVSII